MQPIRISAVANNWSSATNQIHASQVPDPTTETRALPLYQTTSYTFRDTNHVAKLFALMDLGNIVTSIM